MVNPNRFYTYAYLREDKTPYYIGKGKGVRLYNKHKGEVRPPKDKSRIIFLKQNLTEEEAFNHEIYMIAVFGRKDLGTGILRNRTNGGEGISGFVFNEETKERISKSRKGKYGGENHPNYGKSPSEETRKKQSERMRGKNNPNYGKSHSEENRIKMSEKKKGKFKGKNNPNYGKSHSEETKERISKSRKGKYGGENHPNYGKSPSEETRKKQSEAMKGKSPSEETRKKQSESSKGKNNPNYGKRGKNSPNYGKKWWNDRKGNNKFCLECPGENWVVGRGKLKNIIGELYEPHTPLP
jgi:hypothetical protein